MRLVELAGRLDYAASNHLVQRFGWDLIEKEGDGSGSMVLGGEYRKFRILNVIYI